MKSPQYSLTLFLNFYFAFVLVDRSSSEPEWKLCMRSVSLFYSIHSCAQLLYEVYFILGIVSVGLLLLNVIVSIKIKHKEWHNKIEKKPIWVNSQSKANHSSLINFNRPWDSCRKICHKFVLYIWKNGEKILEKNMFHLNFLSAWKITVLNKIKI